MRTLNHHRYNSAFARNQGWVTASEQLSLRGKKVAIAGLGGVGGSHLLTLTRLGIGQFNISDLDTFELANFNRQAGAADSTLGQPKVDVLASMALDINPDLEIQRFDRGINVDNVDAFLDGCDLYVDGLDFFAMEARRLVFERCAQRRIPAVTAAPTGMGAALLTFMPGGMTFEEYFRLEGCDPQEQLIRLMAGLTPRVLQGNYVADETTVDFASHRVPSTVMGCDLCAGLVGTEALKILLNRGKVRPVPQALQFDAYRQRFVRTWRPWGNRNPLQQILLYFLRKRLGKRLDHSESRVPVGGVAG